VSRHAPRTAFLALFTIFLPFLAIPAPPALEDVIPADTVMVILVDNLPGLRAELNDLPLMRAWEDPAIQAAILHFSGLEELPDLPEWLLADEESDTGSDDPHVQLLKSLTGQVAIMLDLDALMAASSGDSPAEDHQLPTGISLLAQIEGHEQEVAALLSTAGGEDVEDDAAAMILPEGTWKIARGVLAISGTPEGADALAAALDGVTKAAPLSGGAGFQTMRRHAANSDIELLVNLEPLMGMAQEALNSGTEYAFSDNPLGVTAQDVLRGLGLDVFRSLWFSLRLSPEATETTAGITFSEERGLIRLAAFQALPAGRRLPLPKGAVDATTYGFDFSASWKAMKEITTDISPVMGAAMEAQIAQMSAQLGIDLGKEIPGAFAGQFASASFLHPLPPGVKILTPEDFTQMLSQVWVAELNPENRLEEAIAALTPILAAMGMTISTRTVDGHVLQILTPAAVDDTASAVEEAASTTSSRDDQATVTAAWIIRDGYLVGGNGHLEDLVAVLTGLDDDGPGIWGVKKVRKSLGSLPEDAFAIQYQDTGLLMKSMVGQLLKALPADEDGGSGMGPDEAEQLAEAMARLLPVSVSAAYRSPGELVFKVRLLHGTP